MTLIHPEWIIVQKLKYAAMQVKSDYCVCIY